MSLVEIPCSPPPRAEEPDIGPPAKLYHTQTERRLGEVLKPLSLSRAFFFFFTTSLLSRKDYMPLFPLYNIRSWCCQPPRLIFICVTAHTCCQKLFRNDRTLKTVIVETSDSSRKNTQDLL